MKKILTILISVTMILASFGGTVFAIENKEMIFNEFVDDYCYVTNLTEDEANDILEEVISSYSDVITDCVEEMCTYLDSDDEYNSILYLQDNYDELTTDISVSEKHQIDLYLMKLSLDYYQDNYGSTTVSNSNVIENSPNVKFEDSLIGDIAIPASSGSGTTVAKLVLFSDPSTNVYTQELFSGIELNYDIGLHSWIVVRNVSNDDIVVGKMTIAPSTEIAVGTWGNKSEHIGVWYNLEPYLINYNAGYTGRVSITCDLTEDKLATLSQFIRNNDSWSYTNNCAAFAEDAWNEVASTSISAGIIKTPKTLGKNIKKRTYIAGETTQYTYTVHYAQGTGTPIESTVFTRTD